MPATGGDPTPPGADRPPRRAQTWLFTVVLVGLVLGTAGGTYLARERALDAVDERAGRTANAVAAVLEGEVGLVAARLAGAGAVVTPAGDLDPETFAAFAADTVGEERPSAMVLLDVVAHEDRQAFEARAGAPIQVVEDGRLRPAPRSATYYPVLSVVGAPPGRSIAGVDFGAEPARRVALQEAGASREPTASGPLTLTTTGERGVAIVRPVAGGDGVIRGFLATAIPVARLVEIIAEAVPAGADVAILDGDAVVVGPDQIDGVDDRRVVTAQVLGRDWQVAVLPSSDPDFAGTWLVALAGSAAIATMATLLVLTERHHRRLARTNALLRLNEERSRALQDVAGRLARALTGGEVASAIIEHLPAAVGARSAVVALVERGGKVEVLVPGADPRPLPPPPVGSVVEGVLSSRQPAWLSSPLGWRGDELATDFAGDASALALVPLLTDDVVGVLAVAYPRLHIFGDDEQALLATIGVLAGRALARGRRYDAEHRAAVAFQRAALPDELPSVPGLAIAARYRPATHGATVGGDWYDALRLGDDRLLLVVGDVVGHGMTAAAAMGRLRTAFQTIVPYRSDPGSMLQGISQQIDAIPDAFCTTVVSAVVDVERGVLSWSRAGHPPPLVVSPSAPPVLLDAPCMPPLGVVSDASAPVHEHGLRPGDVVVLYTDGIVERREESLDQGFERLGIVAEQLVDLGVDELADALVEAMVPAEAQADDLAVLVVRYDGAEPSGG